MYRCISFCFIVRLVYIIFIDAGVVGDYSAAQIIVQNTSSGIITGIQNANAIYATNAQLLNFNATQGLKIVMVLAWSTRILYVEAVPPTDNSQHGSSNDTR